MARLEADAASEKEQKGFCDEAMKAAMESRDAAKAKLEAEKATLESEIADLSAAISDLNKALINATDIRKKEEADNKKTIATAEEGKSAVEEAIKVLKDFYENAFVQRRSSYVPPNSDRSGKTVSDLAPDTFDTTYHGDQTESKGIIGLLEVILSDFERTIAKVTEEEEIAAAAYEKFKTETLQDIAEKTESKEAKEARVVAIKDELIENETNTNEQKTLLETALETLEGLHSKCVAGEETYEDRVAAREKEIE